MERPDPSDCRTEDAASEGQVKTRRVDGWAFKTNYRYSAIDAYFKFERLVW